MPGALSDRHGFLEAGRGPITAVAAARASDDERRRAYPVLEARQIVSAAGREARAGNPGALRALAGAAASGACFRGGDAEALLDSARAAVERKALLLVPGWSWARPAASAAPAPAACAPVTSTPAALQVFELVILGGDGRALAGVPLRVMTPVGEERRVSSDGDGRVRLEALEAGVCAVTSVIEGARVADAHTPATAPSPEVAPAPPKAHRPPPGPAHLVEVVRHRVRSGETPASIAEHHEVPWERIAAFNWGTSDPAALEAHYRDTLGCTRQAPDGSGLRFDDGDDPGILLVPRPWQARLPVGMAHELRVAPLRAVFLALHNEAGLALPGAAFDVRFGDGSLRRGRLGARGLARIDGVPDQPFTVSYPDQLELLAASLAVSVRRAFDEAATAPLFTLLMQSPEVIERATALYHRHLDDLTGRGLRADIDQVITDPEARRPLEALLALPRATWRPPGAA